MIMQIVVYLILIYSVLLLFRIFRPKKLVTPNGKAVLITGCDSGFGNKTAHRLNKIGFKVYATVLSTDSPGAQALQSNAVFSDKMIVLEMNVTNDSQVIEVFEKVKKDLENSGQVLWAVLNNAGINSTCLLEWGTMDNYYKQFDVNLFGAVRVSRVFLPLLRKSQGMHLCILNQFNKKTLNPGRLVNLVSILGRFSVKLIGIYCMSKHALVAFSDTLRREVRPFNVKVSTIEPAFFKTDITDCNILVKQLEDNWNQSSNDVKNCYKYEDYYKVTKNYGKLVEISDKTEAVVDHIIDSIVNTRPKSTYRPIVGLSNRIEMYLALYLPTDMCDALIRLKEKLVFMFNQGVN